MENIAIIPAYMTDTGKQLTVAKLFEKQQNIVKVGVILFFLLSSALLLFAKQGDALSDNEDSQSILLAENPYGISINQKNTKISPISIDNTLIPFPVSYDELDYQIDSNPTKNLMIEGNGIPISLYTVKKNDTLSEIAEKYGVSINTIKWENNLKSNKLVIGRELRILPTTGILHTVRKGDTLSSIAKRYDVSIENIRLYNDIDKLKPEMKLMIPNGVKQEIFIKTKNSSRGSYKSRTKTTSSGSRYHSYFIRPTQGPATSLFGVKRKNHTHLGIDFGNYYGASIFASASGTVTKVTSNCRATMFQCGGRYGNNIVIRHSNGTTTRYAHLKDVLVRVGQKVKQGDKIGTMGNTGNVRPKPKTINSHAGTHLHFEIVDSRTGRKINPNFLK